VSSDESVTAAAASLKEHKGTLYGIVNNAGVGLAHGVTGKDILNVNIHGVKRVCEAFMPLLDQKDGRVVNVSSGAASAYVKGSMGSNKMGAAKIEDRLPMVSFKVTWDAIMGCIDKEVKASEGGVLNPFAAYGLSKAALCAYTMILAAQQPNILTSSCSPGFIATKMSEGFGAKKTPEEGTVSLRHCLLSPLSGNGYYYGSDGKRSPLDKARDPGDPEYDGTNDVGV